MSGPMFRSTAAFTMRQRVAAPVIDRATFVLFSWSTWRFAVPVESVESVLREKPNADGTVAYQNATYSVLALGEAFQRAHQPSDVASARTLMFMVEDTLVGAVVDHVHEVATIDATHVQPLVEAPTDVWSALTAEGGWPVGARGRFTRGAHEVLVLDIARIVRALRSTTPFEHALHNSVNRESVL